MLNYLNHLSLAANLSSILVAEKGFRTSARNLDYQRPPSAILFNHDIKNGAAIAVNFSSNYITANNLVGPIFMLLEISSTRTMLSNEYSIFEKYDCSIGSKPKESHKEPFGSFDVVSLTAYVQITGSTWTLRDIPECIANSFAYTSTYLTETENTYGWIGLATLTYQNFPNSCCSLLHIYRRCRLWRWLDPI